MIFIFFLVLFFGCSREQNINLQNFTNNPLILDFYYSENCIILKECNDTYDSYNCDQHVYTISKEGKVTNELIPWDFYQPNVYIVDEYHFEVNKIEESNCWSINLKNSILRGEACPCPWSAKQDF